jgi:hypothetical protein
MLCDECLSVARIAHLHRIQTGVSCFALHFLHEVFLLPPLCRVPSQWVTATLETFSHAGLLSAIGQ